MEKPVIQWHRLFGIILQDFFADSPYEVELEKDLSIKQQLLDVLIIRKREGEFTGVLPDGMDDLRLHNLLTFKSFQQSLDSWAVEELLGHFVSYRKQVFPRGTPMPAVEEIGLYAVCARRPEK